LTHLNVGNWPKSAIQQISVNARYRRQSGIPTVSTECPKADIYYRLPTLLVADWNSALTVFHRTLFFKIEAADCSVIFRPKSSHI